MSAVLHLQAMQSHRHHHPPQHLTPWAQIYQLLTTRVPLYVSQASIAIFDNAPSTLQLNALYRRAVQAQPIQLLSMAVQRICNPVSSTIEPSLISHQLRFEHRSTSSLPAQANPSTGFISSSTSSSYSSTSSVLTAPTSTDSLCLTPLLNSHEYEEPDFIASMHRTAEERRRERAAAVRKLRALERQRKGPGVPVIVTSDLSSQSCAAAGITMSSDTARWELCQIIRSSQSSREHRWSLHQSLDEDEDEDEDDFDEDAGAFVSIPTSRRYDHYFPSTFPAVRGSIPASSRNGAPHAATASISEGSVGGKRLLETLRSCARTL